MNKDSKPRPIKEGLSKGLKPQQSSIPPRPDRPVPINPNKPPSR